MSCGSEDLNLRQPASKLEQRRHDKQHSRKSVGFEDLTRRLATERGKSSITPTRGSEDLKRLDLPTPICGSEDLKRLDLPTGSEDLKRLDLSPIRGSEDLKRLDLPTGSEDLKRLDLPTGRSKSNSFEEWNLTTSKPLGNEDLSLVARTPNSTKRRKSAFCTATRISRACANDQKTLGTYLPGHHRAFVPAPIQGPDDSFRAPDWFFQEVSRLMSTPVPVPNSPPFLFDMSDESCLHNQNVPASFG